MQEDYTRQQPGDQPTGNPAPPVVIVGTAAARGAYASPRNPKKCHLLYRGVSFLGHVVSSEGVATDPAKVTAVREWPTPCNVAKVCSFLGLASYYWRFIGDFATIANPLHQLTQKGQDFQWSESCTEAFCQLRSALSAAPVFSFPEPQKTFIVDTDASNMGLSALLSQGAGHCLLQLHPQQAREELLRHLSTTAGGCPRSSPLPPLPLWAEVHLADIPRFTHLAAELQEAGGSAGQVDRDPPGLQFRHPAPVRQVPQQHGRPVSTSM